MNTLISAYKYIPGLFCDVLLLFAIPFLCLYNIYTRYIFKLSLICDIYPENTKNTAVFLVHGSGFNSSEFILYRLILYLLNYRYVFSIDYDGIISNKPYSSITDYSYILQKNIIETSNKYNYTECILIGHSMGGLICSYYSEYINRYSKNFINISKIISIGTPWNGSKLISLFHKNEIRYLEINNYQNFITDLKLKIIFSKIQYINIYCKYDLFIINLCDLSSAKNYVYLFGGHYSILLFCIYDLIKILK